MLERHHLRNSTFGSASLSSQCNKSSSLSCPELTIHSYTLYLPDAINFAGNHLPQQQCNKARTAKDVQAPNKSARFAARVFAVWRCRAGDAYECS